MRQRAIFQEGSCFVENIRGKYQIDEGCNVHVAAVFTDKTTWVAQGMLRSRQPARARRNQ